LALLAACSSNADASSGVPISSAPNPPPPMNAGGGAGPATPGISSPGASEQDPLLALPEVAVDDPASEPAPAIVLDNLVVTETGGYQLGEPFDENAVVADPTAMPPGNGEDCGNVLIGVVRDFRSAQASGGHGDFEVFSGGDVTTGLVQHMLGVDQKPTYAALCDTAAFNAGSPGNGICPFNQQLTTQASFDQWYRASTGMNMSYRVYFQFEPTGGSLTFHSQYFYPVDGAGFADESEGNDGLMHNFHFTTELHTKFKYAGGENFTFIGDDDVWVFINGQLALDLGGLHPTVDGSIELDSLATQFGLVPEGIYSLDLFHAERHTNASRFRIDTSLSFVDCGGPAVPR
jgi:fibro-slime domain-containing protein